MRIGITLLCLSALMPACGGGSDGLTRVLVTVRGSATGVRQLDVIATSTGGTSNLKVPEAQRDITLPTTFSIAFPKDRTGSVSIDVTLLSATGSSLGQGTGTVTLVAGDTVPLEINIGGQIVDGGPDDGGPDADIPDSAPADAVPIDGAPGALSIAPPTHDFGNVQVGMMSATQIFTVTNTGGTASGTLATSITGGRIGDYEKTADTCMGMTLNPAATCAVTLRFRPTLRGLNMGGLNVSGAPGGTATSLIQGTAQAPATLTITPTSHDFTTVVIGQSATRAFTVRNTGDLPSGTLATSFTGGDYGASANTCTGTLAAAATCTVTVRFTPTAVGARNGSVTVTATPGGVPSAQLMGTGQTAVDPNLILHWAFDNNSVNQGALAGFGFNLTGASFVTGKFGQALSFGAGGFATVAGMRNVLGTRPDLTIGFWVFEAAQPASSSLWSINNRSAPGPFGGVQLGQSAGNMSVCVASTSNSFLGGSCLGFSAPSVSAWHHYIIRYDAIGTGAGQGGNIEIFLDGALVHTRLNDADNNPIFNTTGMPDTLSIGAQVMFDDMRIYDRVFTAAEQCTTIIRGTFAAGSCTLPP